MDDALDRFVREHAPRAWAWGVVDCTTTLADWAIANGHPDPAVGWRGAYADEAGWRQIVADHGGLVPLLAMICRRAGIERTEACHRGAIRRLCRTPGAARRCRSPG
jgi:hypothetical protein